MYRLGKTRLLLHIKVVVSQAVESALRLARVAGRRGDARRLVQEVRVARRRVGDAALGK